MFLNVTHIKHILYIYIYIYNKYKYVVAGPMKNLFNDLINFYLIQVCVENYAP